MKSYFAGLRAWEVEQGDGLDNIIFDGSGLPPEVLGALSMPQTRRLPRCKNLSQLLCRLSIKMQHLKDYLMRSSATVNQMLLKSYAVGHLGDEKKSDVDVFINGKTERLAFLLSTVVFDRSDSLLDRMLSKICRMVLKTLAWTSKDYSAQSQRQWVA